MVPWFFHLITTTMQGGFQYIAIWDMDSLSSIHKEFEEYSHWIIHKTTRRFSAMPIDQGHEQNNEVVKSSGGLTENLSAFRRWMV